MGFFNKRKKPTAAQHELLKAIVNPQQKKMLLESISKGEEIPGFAWEPLPADMDIGKFGAKVEAVIEAVDEEFESSSGIIAGLIQEVRAMRVNQQGFLDEPLEVFDRLVKVDSAMNLGQWMYFNPMGPTLMNLTMYLEDPSEGALIATTQIHPSQPEIRVYGLLSEQVAFNAEALGRTCVELFGRFAGDDRYPLLNSLPTSVRVDAESPVTEEMACLMFRNAAKRIQVRGLGRTCQMLREYHGDPWKRTSAELEAAMDVARLGLDPPTELGGEDGDEHFDAWWGLVTDPVHVESEFSNFGRAYHGSRSF